MLKKLEDWGYGTCAELKEWGRGCDLKLFSPERRSEPFRAAKQMDETDVVILWVGRLVPEKRPEIWLSAVKRLQAEGLPVKALVVGNGTFEKSLAQVKHVACCGWLSGTALAEAYASADVLVFPSDVETFGNVTLEALASGCPCIVEEKCGGHLVEHGVNGFTCPAGDYEAFFQATKRIVQDAVLRKEMSVKARESSWKFERHKIMQQMLENYKVSQLGDQLFISVQVRSI
jgi:glycosyltransferase involved in cell wall biosynthesis